MIAGSNKQVSDDIGLLNEMMTDLQHSDKLYQPTNYWSWYSDKFLPELKKMGLKDFRRRRESVLNSFGAVDSTISPIVKFTLLKFPFPIPGVGRVNRFFDRLFRKRIEIIEEYTPDEATQYLYWHVKKKFDILGVDINKCQTSEWGNPEDLVEINGSLWSTLHLRYCAMWADAASSIEFKSDMIFCELGSGLGRQIEVMAHLYPDATFLLFDIPPQLYVAHQYLSSVFGRRVVGYREAVKLKPDEQGNLPSVAKGKIVIQPSWRLPDWSNTRINIFWNSASFQEMEPDTVENYLGLAIRMRPEWIYISALPQGNWWGTWKPGMGGTKEQVKDECYFRSLDSAYLLNCKYFTDNLLRKPSYVSYIFKSKSEV